MCLRLPLLPSGAGNGERGRGLRHHPRSRHPRRGQCLDRENPVGSNMIPSLFPSRGIYGGESENGARCHLYSRQNKTGGAYKQRCTRWARPRYWAWMPTSSVFARVSAQLSKPPLIVLLIYIRAKLDLAFVLSAKLITDFLSI